MINSGMPVPRSSGHSDALQEAADDPARPARPGAPIAEAPPCVEDSLGIEATLMTWPNEPVALLSAHNGGSGRRSCAVPTVGFTGLVTPARAARRAA